MITKSVTTKSLEETQKLAQDFVKTLKKSSVLCLYGNLGSGKTSFIQGFAKGLGIKRRITSPTFIIVRQYKIESPAFLKRGGQDSKFFYHIDLYRISNKDDLEGIGLEEILNNKENIVAIEWAEKLFDPLPKQRYDLKFKYLEINKREIAISEYE